MLDKDLREFIELLNSASVEYVIVGAHAVAYYGHPRMTGDLDLLIQPSTENARNIEDVLRRFGFANLGLTADDFQKPDTVVQLGVSPNRIDILTSLTGVDTEAVWTTRVSAKIDGLPVSFISKALLIQNKQATGRTQDIADVEAIQDD